MEDRPVLPALPIINSGGERRSRDEETCQSDGKSKPPKEALVMGMDHVHGKSNSTGLKEEF
jgi:hypothetical protein